MGRALPVARGAATSAGGRPVAGKRAVAADAASPRISRRSRPRRVRAGGTAPQRGGEILARRRNVVRPQGARAGDVRGGGPPQGAPLFATGIRPLLRNRR